MVKDRYECNVESAVNDGSCDSELGSHPELRFPESLLNSLVVGLVGVDEEQRIRYFNPGAERMFRAERGEILGQPLDLLMPARFHAAHADHVRRFAAGTDVTRLEYMRPRITGRRSDGSEFPAEATITKYVIADGTRLLAIVRDLEDEIGILANEDPGVVRALQAVHAVEQVLTNAGGERELLERACAAITCVPGYVLAWAGYTNDGPVRAVRPITASGTGETHLARGVPLDLGGEPDPALIRSAIETGELATAHELARDQGLWPLGDAAEREGIGSALALPLRRSGKVFGVLCVAAGIDHAFGESECRLLMQAVNQVTSGLMMHRAREASGLEPEIVDRLAAIVLGSADVIAFMDSSGSYFYLNPAGQHLTGHHGPEHGAPLSARAIHPEDAARHLVDDAIPVALRHGQWVGQTAVLGDGGEAVPVSMTLIAHRASDGELVCLAALMRSPPEDDGTAAAGTTADASAGDDHARLLAAAEAGLRLLAKGGGRSGPADVIPLKVPVVHKDHILLLDTDDVAWIQADRHYARVMTARDNFLSSHGLVDLESRLDPTRFVRVHRSHIINVRYALEIEHRREDPYVILDLPDHPRIPISRRRLDHVREILGLV